MVPEGNFHLIRKRLRVYNVNMSTVRRMGKSKRCGTCRARKQRFPIFFFLFLFVGEICTLRGLSDSYSSVI